MADAFNRSDGIVLYGCEQGFDMNAYVNFPLNSQFDFKPMTDSTFSSHIWPDVCDLTDSTAVIGAGDLNFLVSYVLNDSVPEITDVQPIMHVNDSYMTTGSLTCNAPLLAYLTESLTDALAKEQKRLARMAEPDELDDMFAFFDKHSFKG